MESTKLVLALVAICLVLTSYGEVGLVDACITAFSAPRPSQSTPEDPILIPTNLTTQATPTAQPTSTPAQPTVLYREAATPAAMPPRSGWRTFPDLQLILIIVSFLAALVGIPAGIAQILSYLIDRRRERERARAALRVASIEELSRSRGIAPLVAIPVPDVFIDREEAIAEKIRVLRDPIKRVLFVVGLAGVGKTVLTAKVASELRRAFEGVYWTRCTQETTLEAVLSELSIFLLEHGDSSLEGVWNNPNLSSVQKLNVLFNALSKLYLLVFDDFQEILTEECFIQNPDLADLFERFLWMSHQAKVILISRYYPNILEHRHLPHRHVNLLEGFDEPHSGELLARLGLAIDRTAVREAWRQSEGHPYALELLAALAQRYPIDHLLTDGALLEAGYGHLIGRLLQNLQPSEVQTLRTMAITRQPLPIDAIMGLDNQKDTTRNLGVLANKALVKFDPDRKLYSLHSLVRDCVYGQMEDDLCRRYHIAAADYYSARPVPSERQSLADVQNLLEARYHYYSAREYDRAGAIATDLFMSLFRWGYIELCESLANHTVNTVLDKKIKATALHQLARLSHFKGRTGEAEELWTESLRLFEALGDRSGVAYALHSLGRISQTRGEYAKALERYSTCLQIESKLGEYEKAGITNHQIAYTYFLQSEYDRALAECNMTLEYRQWAKHEGGIAISLHLRGMIYEILGDYAQALKDLDTSLEIERRHQNQNRIAICLRSQGNILFDQGKYDLAKEKYEESLRIQEQLGNKLSLAECLDRLGEVDLVKDAPEAALKLFERAYAIRVEAQLDIGIAQSLHRIGKAHRIRREFERARALFEESLEVKQRIGAKLGIVETLYELAQIDQAEGHKREARARYEEALRLCRSIGYRRGIAEVLYRLAEMDLREGEVAKAKAELEEGAELFRTLGHVEWLGRCLQSLGHIKRVVKREEL